MESEQLFIPSRLPLRVTFDADFLYRVEFVSGGEQKTAKGRPKSAFAIEIEAQFLAYFNGELKKFDLPYKILKATNFQRQVWQTMAKIAYGKSMSYGELGERAGFPKSFRAVGSACNRNPLAIIIPCHRVLAKNGLGGFAPGLSPKKLLLNLEGISYFQQELS